MKMRRKLLHILCCTNQRRECVIFTVSLCCQPLLSRSSTFACGLIFGFLLYSLVVLISPRLIVSIQIFICFAWTLDVKKRKVLDRRRVSRVHGSWVCRRRRHCLCLLEKQVQHLLLCFGSLTRLLN
jgi:hypothetical protein